MKPQLPFCLRIIGMDSSGQTVLEEMDIADSVTAVGAAVRELLAQCRAGYISGQPVRVVIDIAIPQD